MIASRWTLATIEAAAIEPSRASPRTSGVCGAAMPGIVRASTSTWSGCGVSASTARRIASSAAW
jgi:hypothetical protein